MHMVSSPLNCSVDNAPSDVQMEIIDLQSDSLKEENLRTPEEAYSEDSSPLWIYQLCEQAFSVMKFNKSKHRSSITDDHLSAVLCIVTSDIQPDFSSLVQAQSTLYYSH